jgi:hypothetical protein
MKIRDRNFEEYIDFQEISEPWNLYALEDGSVVKFRLVLVKVIPISGATTKTYAVNSANVVGVLAPKDLKGTPGVLGASQYQVENKDISFETIEEKWNEYRLEDGNILKIKPAITGIDKTKNYDSNGEPIYIVHSQVLIKT